MARPQAAFAISQALTSSKRDDPGKLWAPVLQDLPLFAGVPKRHIRKIAGLTREGRFREDLYFRLTSVSIDVPPLRQRPVDTGILVRHYLDLFALRAAGRLTIGPDALARLERYSWPDNIRELRNVCEQVAIFGTDPVTFD